MSADRLPLTPRRRRFQRLLFGVVLLVAWVPGAITLAMLLTGRAG